MNILYPQIFEQLLTKDKNLRAAVDGTASDFSIWLQDSKLPFFTDYTDHGINHLNQVLSTTAHLITADSHNSFTPSDAAILIIAVLFHDAAMHLSESGFRQIILGKVSNRSIQKFKDMPWPKLWDDYLFSAKRWDDRKLRQIFGENQQGLPLGTVKDPFDNYDDLSESGRKLIGEFIRIHHARLAHEFAVYGVPGPSLDSIKADARFGVDLCDIAGLIARSHGLPIRRCIDYLQEKYHRREYKNIHAVFLMALLRVSDHLQIHAERAPAMAFKYRHIPSLLSQQEWKAHRAIVNITQTHDDPESIEIQAKPEDAKTFVRLKEWLLGIQEELDASWAILGEVYGSHKKLSKLGLILRRVRSNLDDVEKFAENVVFVPERIELGVARPDLLKLLVGPLYDNLPEIGIRELLQNAVDSVRERLLLQDKYPELQNAKFKEQNSDIEIWLDTPNSKGCAWLTICDKGVGMSVEVIRDYFLTAGASFRNSDTWKRDFEVDDQPRSKVLRSGRFGVGVLAGFLLGPKMEIKTRHIRDKVGIRFVITLEPDIIELRYEKNLPVGTTIRILVPAKVYQTLVNSSGRVSVPRNYDWFCYSHPTVKSFRGSEKEILKTAYQINPDDLSKPSMWRKLRNLNEYEVYWSYFAAPQLSVNGIFITESSIRSHFSKNTKIMRIDNNITVSHFPKICIQDRDGVFPLNLQRSNITEKSYPFEQQLIDDIIDDFLAFLIERWPEIIAVENWARIETHPAVKIHNHEEGLIFKYYFHYLVGSANGFTLLNPGILKMFEPTSILFLFSNTTSAIETFSEFHDLIIHTDTKIRDYFPKYIKENDFEVLKILDFIYWLFTEREKESWRDYSDIVPYKKHILGVRAIMPVQHFSKIGSFEQMINDINTLYEKALDSYYGSSPTEPDEVVKLIKAVSKFIDTTEGTIGSHVSMTTKNCFKSRFNISSFERDKKLNVSAIEIFLDHSSWENVKPGKIASRWDSLIQSPVIPLQIAERKERLSYAYKALNPFVEAHRAMVRDGINY